jgi:hypothetical protein
MPVSSCQDILHQINLSDRHIFGHTYIPEYQSPGRIFRGQSNPNVNIHYIENSEIHSNEIFMNDQQIQHFSNSTFANNDSINHNKNIKINIVKFNYNYYDLCKSNGVNIDIVNCIICCDILLDVCILATCGHTYICKTCAIKLNGKCAQCRNNYNQILLYASLNCNNNDTDDEDDCQIINRPDDTDLYVNLPCGHITLSNNESICSKCQSEKNMLLKIYH